MWLVAIILDSAVLNYTTSNISLDPGLSSSDFTTKENFLSCSIHLFYHLVASFTQFPEYLNPNPVSVAVCFCLPWLLLDVTSLLGLWGEEPVGKGPCSQDVLFAKLQSHGPPNASFCKYIFLFSFAGTHLILHTQPWQKSADPISISRPKQADYGIAKRLASGESLEEEATAIQWLQSCPLDTDKYHT